MTNQQAEDLIDKLESVSGSREEAAAIVAKLRLGNRFPRGLTLPQQMALGWL